MDDSALTVTASQVTGAPPSPPPLPASPPPAFPPPEYTFQSTPQTRAEASASCAANGKALASLRDAGHNAAAFAVVTANTGSQGWVWLGGTREGTKWTAWSWPAGDVFYHATSASSVETETYQNFGYTPHGAEFDRTHSHLLLLESLQSLL